MRRKDRGTVSLVEDSDARQADVLHTARVSGWAKTMEEISEPVLDKSEIR